MSIKLLFGLLMISTLVNCEVVWTGEQTEKSTSMDEPINEVEIYMAFNKFCKGTASRDEKTWRTTWVPAIYGPPVIRPQGPAKIQEAEYAIRNWENDLYLFHRFQAMFRPVDETDWECDSYYRIDPPKGLDDAALNTEILQKNYQHDLMIWQFNEMNEQNHCPLTSMSPKNTPIKNKFTDPQSTEELLHPESFHFDKTKREIRVKHKISYEAACQIVQNTIKFDEWPKPDMKAIPQDKIELSIIDHFLCSQYTDKKSIDYFQGIKDLITPLTKRDYAGVYRLDLATVSCPAIIEKDLPTLYSDLCTSVPKVILFHLVRIRSEDGFDSGWKVDDLFDPL